MEDIDNQYTDWSDDWTRVIAVMWVKITSCENQLVYRIAGDNELNASAHILRCKGAALYVLLVVQD